MYDIVRLKNNADLYCENNSTSIEIQLGRGMQGVVYKTKKNTAIKAHEFKVAYERELGVYKRLLEREITIIHGLMIPRLLDSDDNLNVFEMSIVHVPCLIDFGGAYIDSPPDHMIRDDNWSQAKMEEFGEHWKDALALIKELERKANIYLADVNTGNIKFSIAK